MRMVELPMRKRHSFRQVVLGGLSLAVLFGGLTPSPAAARHHHHHGRIVLAQRVQAQRAMPHGAMPHARHGNPRAFAHVRPGSYTPPFSALAVDGNSGRVLYGRDENELRHPASLTKVMTLYLLFEQLEKRKLALDSDLHISAHAASQSPTKLGLRAGSTIRVEDAIKAIVTKSANDMAVAVAEEIGGDEESFARMMTHKAHALGMSRTLYRNASGLPNDEQLTTAHDLVILGRAVHDHFPRYYHYFSTPSFRYAGQFMPNHNHLMEQIEGMDGIKTGYTRASGFNLLTSVKRNGHYLVSVVLGGKTRLGRDRIMADLIEAQLDKCATIRTAGIVEENPALEQVAEAIPVVQHIGENAPAVEAVSDDEAETPSAPVAAAEAPAPAPSLVVPHAEVASLTNDTSGARARPAYVPGAAKALGDDRMATASIRPRQTDLDGSTGRRGNTTLATTATPSRRALRKAARDQAAHEQAVAKETAAHDDKARQDKAREEKAREDRSKVAPVKLALAGADHAAEAERPAAAQRGWMIQIGATDNIAKANDLLSRARNQSGGMLGSAKPFTEKVQKGSGTLFRARFAGLEANAADSACKALKRSGFSCFATRN